VLTVILLKRGGGPLSPHSWGGCQQIDYKFHNIFQKARQLAGAGQILMGGELLLPPGWQWFHPI